MDIRESLLEEHSKQQALKIAGWIGNDPQRFAVLVELMLDEEYRVGQRAAWVLTHCLDQHPELLQPHLERLIHNLQDNVQHEAVRRNTVRALQFVDIPEELLGETADLCFRYLMDVNEPVAVRVHAMSVLWNICRKEPELSQELKLIIEDQWEYASAGFRSRGRKILKAIAKQEEGR
ncbi:MAG: hypothetical protein R2824_19205 [Saprospiraceae bacterium]|nr:HEAT repeat domain-containing protein [Lewinella sp.]